MVIQRFTGWGCESDIPLYKGPYKLTSTLTEFWFQSFTWVVQALKAIDLPEKKIYRVNTAVLRVYKFYVAIYLFGVRPGGLTACSIGFFRFEEFYIDWFLNDNLLFLDNWQVNRYSIPWYLIAQLINWSLTYRFLYFKDWYVDGYNKYLDDIWLAKWWNEWMVYLLIDWLIDGKDECMVYLLIDWLFDKLIDWLIERKDEWMVYLLIDWLIEIP